MSLWVQLTVNGRPTLVNLELATWMEQLDDSAGGGTRLHFSASQSLSVGENIETIAEILELFDEEDLDEEGEEE